MPEEKNDKLPKLKLRRGLRPTNVQIQRDGKTFTERVEPGKIYQGEEYHRWVPRILVPVDPTVKVESLKVPEPAPHRRGLRRMRRVLSPAEKPTGPKVKAVMRKKHEETPAPKAEAPAPPPAKKPKPKKKAAPKKKAPKKKAARKPAKKKAKAKRRSG